MKSLHKIKKSVGTAAALVALSASLSFAGPVIIDGTDGNDHGSVSGGVNIGGWKYMQKALDSLAPGVSNTNKILVDLGTTSTSFGDARDAINSAFGLSTLVGAGWSIVHIDGATDIATYLSGGTVGTTNLANSGLMYLSTSGNAIGDITTAELAAINSAAAAVASFVSGGGGLFAQGETGTGAFGWLSTLVPGITVTDQTANGVNTALSLTAAGSTAFPGLTNADLSTGPWHANFGGSLGTLSVLATAPDDSGFTRNVIIGGGSSTVIASAPEGGTTIVMLGLALMGIAGFRRKFII